MDLAAIENDWNHTAAIICKLHNCNAQKSSELITPTEVHPMLCGAAREQLREFESEITEAEKVRNFERRKKLYGIK